MNMPVSPEKHTIAIVSACMRVDGTPDLVLTEVNVTQEEAENGIHYYIAEAELLDAGFEEPFVHFGDNEGPSFLHAAVRLHLGLSPAVNEPITLTVVKEC